MKYALKYFLSPWIYGSFMGFLHRHTSNWELIMSFWKSRVATPRFSLCTCGVTITGRRDAPFNVHQRNSTNIDVFHPACEIPRWLVRDCSWVGIQTQAGQHRGRRAYLEIWLDYRASPISAWAHWHWSHDNRLDGVVNSRGSWRTVDGINRMLIELC